MTGAMWLRSIRQDVLQKTATGEYVFLNRQFRVDPGPIGPADDVLITKFDAAAAKW
jgi:hypothetical protein